ncbi:MAG: protoporphyrinogen oxidase [Anaerolineae bacterium]|nr:protoporphyrinogen oxidase [Anaerolineae bacterium]
MNPHPHITHAPRRHVTVIGGGVTGLTAAWALQQAGLAYSLIEQTSRWGGKICTELVDTGAGDPFVVEAGPDSFIAQKPWATQLARAIGLGDQLLGTNDERRRTYVLIKGRLVPLPDGLMLIVPTRFMPFALSPLISLPGKLRMAVEAFMPAKKDDGDESLADFVRRRLGSEALDKLAEPLMSGIYNTDPYDQSLLATFPRFRALEQKHGSLTRGMLAARRAPHPAHGHGDGPSSLFISFKGGMRMLADRLVELLDGDLRLNTGVEQIERLDDGRYRLHLSGGSTLETDVVLLTTPAPVVAKLLADLAPEAAAIAADIQYVSTGTLSLGYRAEDLAGVPEGFGVVIPRSEGRKINAVTLSSTKFDHRAPAGYALVRTFFGGARSPASVDLDDDALTAVVRDELRDIYGITAEPLFTRIYRWKQATPQYGVGHLDQIARLEAALPPHLFVTGSAFRGVGVPDCVHQAQQTVEQIVAAMTEAT